MYNLFPEDNEEEYYDMEYSVLPIDTPYSFDLNGNATMIYNEAQTLLLLSKLLLNNIVTNGDEATAKSLILTVPDLDNDILYVIPLYSHEHFPDFLQAILIQHHSLYVPPEVIRLWTRVISINQHRVPNTKVDLI